MSAIRIALSGKMRSGKDTVARHLVEVHGFEKFAFSDRLKEVAASLFGARETGKNRALLQELGWRMCQVDRAVWVKNVIDRIPLTLDVVVSDLRFPIEYYALRGLDFCMVRVSIGEVEQWRRIVGTDPGMPAELLGDASETALDLGWRWDYVLDGGVGLAELFQCVNLIVEELKLREGTSST